MEKIVPIIDIPYNKIARRVIACGDPARAEKISKRLENVEVVAKSREYWTFNGTYKGGACDGIIPWRGGKRSLCKL